MVIIQSHGTIIRKLFVPELFGVSFGHLITAKCIITVILYYSYSLCSLCVSLSLSLCVCVCVCVCVQVQYYGLIQQVTGEDWENANISLSTAQPSVGGSAPPLNTKIIRFKRPKPRYYETTTRSRMSKKSSTRYSHFDEYDPTIVSNFECT